MGWGSKRTCGWCGKSGHNRRTCPSLKDYVKNNPDTWIARNEVYRQERYKDNSGAARTCSYCRQTGHNKRTCSVLSNDIVNGYRAQKEYRQNVLERLQEIGFGVGAIIHCKDNYLYKYDEETHKYFSEKVENSYWLVTEMPDDKLAQVTHVGSRVYCAKLEAITDVYVKYGHKENRPQAWIVLGEKMFDPDDHDSMSELPTRMCVVVGKLTAEQVKDQFPKNWVNQNKNVVEKYFGSR